MVHHSRSPYQRSTYEYLIRGDWATVPPADFAGVLINLNVDKAIDRGKSALNLTDHFLLYNKARQIMGRYSGAIHTLPCPQTPPG